MKQYIKSLMGLLLLGVCLTSCVEDKDYGQYDGLTYPEKISLGCWGYDNGYNLYNVNVTLNTQGDTVCNIVCLRRGSEKTDTLIFSNGLLQKYTAQVGLAEFGFGKYYWEGEGLNYEFATNGYLAYKRDLTTMMLNIYPLYNNRPMSGSALASRLVAATYPLVYGFWIGYDEATGSMMELALNRDGSSQASIDGGSLIEGRYTVAADGSVCDVVPDDGVSASFRLHFNALRQLVGEVNGVSYVFDKEQLDNNLPD